MIPLTYGVAPTLPQINTVLLDLPSGAEQNFFFFFLSKHQIGLKTLSNMSKQILHL